MSGYLFMPSKVDNVHGTNIFDESGCIITSLEDEQEVHSVVVVDATTWGASKVEVLVNGVLMANYLPFYWNNIEEPVGEYNITVNIYDDNNTIISNDTKTVIIPLEFIVPDDYVFDEGFVIHEGQTVTFDNNTWELYQRLVNNGINRNDLKNWYPINNFGTLIIKDANVWCDTYEGWSNSQLILDNGNLYLSDRMIVDAEGYDSGNIPIFRTDANYTLLNGGYIYSHSGYVLI